MTDLEGKRLEGAAEMARAGTRRGSGHSGDRGRGFGLYLRRVPAQGWRGLRTRQRVSAAVGLARPRQPTSQPAEPHARRRRGGKRACTCARARRAEPRDLAQDGAARGSGGARRRGGARLRGRQHQRARGERRPRRDGRHAGPPSPSRSRPAGPRSEGSASRWRRSPTTSRRRSPCCAPTPTSWRR